METRKVGDMHEYTGGQWKGQRKGRKGRVEAGKEVS